MSVHLPQKVPKDSIQVQLRVQVIRQVHGDKAGPSQSAELGSGLVRITRIKCSPVIAGQVHGHEAGTRSSWKVSLWVRISLGQA